MNEFISGCVGGALGTSVCYPLDTIKTCIQTNTPIKLRGLYNGFTSPLIGVICEKSVLFAAYGHLQRRYEFTPFVNGIISGLLTTFIVTPFERVKVIAQTQNTTTIQALRGIPLNTLYRGWSATLFREVPGYGVYFTVYEKMKKLEYNTMISGAVSGMSAWAVIYPSDPIKTTMQHSNIGARQAIQKIGYKGMYKGFTPAIIRAGLFHSLVFVGYEYSIKKID
jgi:hypothetical protein